MLRASSSTPPNPGVLTVAMAPAGHAADVTARLGQALAAADLIVTADAEWLTRLAAALGVTLAGRVVSRPRSQPGVPVPELLAELRAGQDVLLVAAGGPAGGDDADRSLVAAASAAGIPVRALPGPAAITAALAIAGLPAGRFTFEGVPPRRAGERQRLFAELAAEQRTLIFLESPGRLRRTLTELAVAFGAGRSAVVCRALAATGEDVQRGALDELAGQVSAGRRVSAGSQVSAGRRVSAGRQVSAGAGSQDLVTVVVAGAPVLLRRAAAPGEQDALAAAVTLVRDRVLDGATTREAVAAVAEEAGLRKRDLYNAVGRRPH